MKLERELSYMYLIFFFFFFFLLRESGVGSRYLILTADYHLKSINCIKNESWKKKEIYTVKHPQGLYGKIALFGLWTRRNVIFGKIQPK